MRVGTLKRRLAKTECYNARLIKVNGRLTFDPQTCYMHRLGPTHEAKGPNGQPGYTGQDWVDASKSDRNLLKELLTIGNDLKEGEIHVSV